ncbi:MAG TPA: YidC/Oxa1 family membrane protein insertase [Acidimicrobiales bacterium]|jgi:YidC/Oxa1 family membrane protein insertase|nr:YidC/Oxa1 family membrane protein insertase [Acidimicrobiales bacterium]
MSPLAFAPHLLAAQFWILDPIYSAMGTVLAWFYAIVPSYGLAIALLTIAVRVLLIPLTTKQVKSQQAMQRIQPELKRLQAKYKDDRTKLNEEMMKFYKENKVNPVAGCLPLLLQTPLFLVLYRLILGLTHKPTPKHLPASSEMYRSLVQSGGRMVSWGIDLAQSASTQKGIGKALPFYVLIAITIATGFYQQRQMTARMPAGSANAQMKMIGRVFPVMIGLISFRIPAGVVVYFIISNAWQIVQQEITFRTMGPPPGATPASKVDKDTSKPSRDGGRAKGLTDGGGKPSAGGRGANNKTPKKGEPTPGRGAKSGGKQQPPPKQQPPKQQGRQQPKGKRPPPSPRPKGLPEPGSQNGQANPPAKNIPPRKDG